LKIAVGSVADTGGVSLEEVVRGRDLVTGLPREVIITETDIREAMSHSIETLVESVREILEETPPEVLADVMQRGVYLVGGGALISGMADLLKEHLGVSVYVAEDPLTAVVRGTGVILEDFDALAGVLIANEDDFS
jgi:rod shape-determining protein MreB